MRQGFPKSVDDCRRMLAAHQAETGYLTCPVATNTRIMPNYGAGGGYRVVDGRKRQIVTFYADQSIWIQTRGTYSAARLARINACLPFGYTVRRNGLDYELLRHGAFCARFVSSFQFTPVGALVEAA